MKLPFGLKWHIFIVAVCFDVTASGKIGSERVRGRNIASRCRPCDVTQCPVVTGDTCSSGHVVKDRCDCCPVCVSSPPSSLRPAAVIGLARTNTSTAVLASHPAAAVDNSAACEEITCGRYEVCMLNIQGIPVCRCPTKFMCMKKERTPICGDDNVTYRSRCYLKMAECESSRNIQVKHTGKCERSEADRKLREERKIRREEKEQKKVERQRLRMEKKQRRSKKAERKQKKRKNKRKENRNASPS